MKEKTFISKHLSSEPFSFVNNKIITGVVMKTRMPFVFKSTEYHKVKISLSLFERNRLSFFSGFEAYVRVCDLKKRHFFKSVDMRFKT